MKRLLLVLAFCAFAAAFIPKAKRALNEESDSVIYCAADTPCAWTTYNPHTRIVDSRIVNDYCLCNTGLTCKKVEDNKSMNVITEYCKSPDFEELEL